MPFTTRFDDELNPASVALALQIWRDKAVSDKAAAGIAVLNVQSFAMGKALGQPHVALAAAAAATDEEIEAAFATAMAHAEGRMHAQAGGMWLTIILGIALRLIPIIFPGSAFGA